MIDSDFDEQQVSDFPLGCPGSSVQDGRVEAHLKRVVQVAQQKYERFALSLRLLSLTFIQF